MPVLLKVPTPGAGYRRSVVMSYFDALPSTDLKVVSRPSISRDKARVPSSRKRLIVAESSDFCMPALLNFASTYPVRPNFIFSISIGRLLPPYSIVLFFIIMSTQHSFL